MRKLIVMMSISVDGFMQGPDRDISWHQVNEEMHRHFNEELGAMGAFLHGRVTYELMADAWAAADQEPSYTPVMREFGQIWRAMPKVVYSTTLEQAEWNATVVRQVVADDVLALKREPGGDMVVGGANLAATFMRLGLVDEYRLYVHPVAIGRGSPVFPPHLTVELQLNESRIFGNGVAYLRYQPR